MPSPPGWCIRHWLLMGSFAALFASEAIAQSTLISLPTRRDMVFDHGGHYLYISTSDGLVQRYNLTSGVLETPFAVGGSLNGMDIAADDSFLLLAQGNATA